MDRNDIEEVHQEQERQERLAQERDDFRLALQRASGNHRRTAAAAGSLSISDWTSLEQQEMKKYIPPGTSIWKANKAEGWAGHCPPYARTSETTEVQTPLEAAKALARRLWRQHNEKKRIYPLTTCPIEGLFPEAPQDAAAAGGSKKKKK